MLKRKKALSILLVTLLFISIAGCNTEKQEDVDDGIYVTPVEVEEENDLPEVEIEEERDFSEAPGIDVDAFLLDDIMHEDLIGNWVYSHMTEGEDDTPVPTPGEFDFSSPGLEISEEVIEMASTSNITVYGNIRLKLYESLVIGKIDYISINTFTISEITIFGEGDAFPTERIDRLSYNPQTGVLRYTASRAELGVDDIHYHFVR